MYGRVHGASDALGQCILGMGVFAALALRGSRCTQRYCGAEMQNAPGGLVARELQCGPPGSSCLAPLGGPSTKIR